MNAICIIKDNLGLQSYLVTIDKIDDLATLIQDLDREKYTLDLIKTVNTPIYSSILPFLKVNEFETGKN